MKGIEYLRVSTSEQADHGYGLEVQRRAIEQYAEREGVTLAEVHQDAGISGTSALDGRPGLASAFAALEAGRGDRLLVYRLDRLARDLVMQELLVAQLSARGTAVVSVTEPDLDTLATDPTKVLIRQLLGALAQFERAIIRGRMDAGRAAKAAAGGYVGGAPRYGLQAASGGLAVSDAEQAVVVLVHELRSQGRSYRHICDALSEAGYRPRRAGKWHPAVVRDIALRETSDVAA